jgi:hypothetical protein
MIYDMSLLTKKTFTPLNVAFGFAFAPLIFGAIEQYLGTDNFLCKDISNIENAQLQTE